MLKKLMLAFLLAVACVFILPVLFLAYLWLFVAPAKYDGCHPDSTGYEKYTWYESGKNRRPALPGRKFFPAEQFPLRFHDLGVRYDQYVRAIGCADEINDNINIVRFTVRPGVRFTRSAKFTDAGQVPKGWNDLPVGHYVAVGARQKHRLHADDEQPPRSWLTAPDRTPGRKALIAALGVDWLKDEPLDEAHLLGVWQGGWLFQSARRGYYVWVD